jgi:predicted lipoprotein with Yx(FWY)xxD motif
MKLRHIAISQPAAIMLLLSAMLAAATVSAQNAAPAAMKDGMLVGSNGMTLYTYDKDADGKSMCNGKCAENWPPLGADGASAASGDFSVVTRDDGKKQYAYKGKPLYHFIKDQKPGDKTGEGTNNVWHVAR